MARYFISFVPSSIKISGPSVTNLPFSQRVLSVALRPQSQIVLISSILCAICKSRVEPSKPPSLRRKLRRRPKHMTGIFSFTTTSMSWSACFGVKNCASSTSMQSTPACFLAIQLKRFVRRSKQKSVSLSGPMRVSSFVPFFVSVAGLITQTFCPRSS